MPEPCLAVRMGKISQFSCTVTRLEGLNASFNWCILWYVGLIQRSKLLFVWLAFGLEIQVKCTYVIGIVYITLRSVHGLFNVMNHFNLLLKLLTSKTFILYDLQSRFIKWGPGPYL